MTLQDIMNLGNNRSMKFVVICSDGITAKGTYEEVMANEEIQPHLKTVITSSRKYGGQIIITL